MIYLDNAATTRCFFEVSRILDKYNTEEFFNPSALYSAASPVISAIKEARVAIARAINALPSEIYFTSGATEACNIAVFGAHKNKKGFIVSSEAEHQAVYNSVKAQGARGENTYFLPLDKNGKVCNELPQNISAVSLLSVMHVCNETGAINDISSLARAAKSRSKNALIHSDGAQAVGKMPVDVKKLGVDIYSFSGHKIRAPKGVGVLYVREGVKLNNLTHGGGQENGLRPGTENIGGIVATAYALERKIREADVLHVTELKRVLLSELGGIDGLRLNSDDACIPHIVSLSFEGVRGEVLMHLLSRQNILIGTGSACSSRRSGNRVLSAMGVPESLISGSVRISFDEYSTAKEIAEAANALARAVASLRT